jgi:hypothetical protein
LLHYSHSWQFPVLSPWLTLPILTKASKLPLPLETLQVVTAIQGAVFVFIAALVGAVLAPKVGLAAPVTFAVARSGSVVDALRPQLVPGIVGGCIGAAIILGFYALAPNELVAIQPDTPLPLPVRVLYGGITAEILVRWGLMSTMVWVGWRILSRTRAQPSSGVIWMAIILSALVFGVAHLPSVAQSLPEMSGHVAAHITIGNSLFGLVAGYLFWRYGLEAAIVAHVLAHLLAFAVRG